jgi:hypothetical protein
MNLTDMSLHRQGGWRNQLSRLRRWHERVRLLGAGVSADEQDTIYAFFQNCFALKDWLKNSGAVNCHDLNAFIKSHTELSLCRDLANGTKHYSLHSASIDAHFFICREYVPAGSYEARSGHNARPVICAGGTKSDLFELADRCMKLWEQFLMVRKLL